MLSQPTDLTNRKCSVENCSKPVRARGFCVACYYRKLRHGEFTPKTPTRKWKHRLSDIDEQGRSALCACCGPTKIVRRGVNQWRCATDANERSKLYKRAYRQSKRIMLVDSCEICGSDKKLCWDHSHETGLFRGILCSNCNTAIGLFKDDIQILRQAIKYLEKSGEDHE